MKFQVTSPPKVRRDGIYLEMRSLEIELLSLWGTQAELAVSTQNRFQAMSLLKVGRHWLALLHAIGPSVRIDSGIFPTLVFITSWTPPSKLAWLGQAFPPKLAHNRVGLKRSTGRIGCIPADGAKRSGLISRAND